MFFTHFRQRRGSIDLLSARDTPAQKRVRENISTSIYQVAVLLKIRSSGLDLQDLNAIKRKKEELSAMNLRLKK